MKEAEIQPNRNISRRKLLKSIGRVSLVAGIGLAGVSGIDLYSKVKKEQQRTHEAEKEVEAKGITKPDKKVLQSAQRLLKEIKKNPLVNRSEEEIRQAERIVAEQKDYDVEVFRIDWIDNPTPHTPTGDKIRDIGGAMIGVDLAVIGGSLEWAARQK